MECGDPGPSIGSKASRWSVTVNLPPAAPAAISRGTTPTGENARRDYAWPAVTMNSREQRIKRASFTTSDTTGQPVADPVCVRGRSIDEATNLYC